MSVLIEDARAWVIAHYGRDAQHLLRTESWLRQLDPTAADATILAALTHDMERAFPGPDSPVQDLSRGVDDPIYNHAHEARSARIVGDYLRDQGAPDDLIVPTTRLINVHEEGGWAEANLVQAADSLSFLEVNVDLFLSWIPLPEKPWDYHSVHAKFTWMYERIQVPSATASATPLYQAAMQKLAAFTPQAQ